MNQPLISDPERLARENAALRMHKLLMEGTSGAQLVAGGLQTLAAALPLNNTHVPNDWQSLVEWQGNPAAVEWQVQTQLKNVNLVDTFPNQQYVADYAAGAYAGGSDIWNDGGTSVIARIEMGSGPVSRVIYTDLRPGRFALGVQSRVKVSIARWITADPNGIDLQVQSTLGPAQASDADPPTYSAAIEIPAGEQRYMLLPAGAQWFDLALGSATAQARVSLLTQALVTTGVFYKDSTLAGPTVYPPSTPWPVPINGSVVFVANVGAGSFHCTLTFWVR